MTRRPLSSLLAILITITSAVAADSWRVHPVFSAPVSRAIATSTDVVFLAGGSLFGYDKAHDERMSYTTDNYLSSAGDISSIFSDPASERILIAYEGGNIDIFTPGRQPKGIVNFPDIAAATGITGGREIRDVAFAGDTAYIATDFGLVVADIANGETLASGRYGEGVAAVALTPSRVVIVSNKTLYSAPRGSRITSLDGFTPLGEVGDVAEMTALNANLLLLRRDVNSAETIRTVSLDDNGGMASEPKRLSSALRRASAFNFTPSGDVRFTSSGTLYEATSEGKLNTLVTLHEDISSDAIACLASTDEIWAAGIDGLACYAYDPASGWSIRSERYRPEALSVKRVAFITPSADGNRIYFSNLGPTVYRLGYQTGDEGLRLPQNASVLEDGVFTDVTAYPVDAKFQLSHDLQYGVGRYPLAPTQMAEDPDDPSTYWLGTGNDGLYRITNGELTGRYDEDNSPFIPQYGCRVYHVSFDRGGNMWVASHTGPGTSGIAVLPAEKRHQDPATITAADWIVLPIPDYESNKDVIVLHCRRSNMIFLTDATVKRLLVAIDTRGTFSDLSDDLYKVWETITDQDGKTFGPDRHSALAEDLDGNVWLGTSGGVLMLPYPQEAVTSSLTATHVKVPRNDGTNTADYLLDSDLVYSIAVDHANRKWFATEGSGVFLTSPKGDEIIKSFNASNSPLPSNRVNAVFCHPSSAAVFFGTDRGVVEYTSTATPAADTFDDILVYPNPVGPDHNGPVTITGLMDSSLVKIANTAGQVVWQGRSEGGMAQWPVTDAAGRRVRSGVYYIIVSKSGQDVSTSGAVAKVVVTN